MIDPSRYILIVTKCRDDAFTALFFEGLPADLRRHLRILEFGRAALTGALAGAAAVIVMRHGLLSFGSLSACAGLLRVPRYYFLDDNLLLLHEEPEVYGPHWSQYTDDNVRRALSGYEGVLLASRPLMAYFSERRLHSRLMEFPPIAGPILRPREPAGVAEPFRIAFFGGEHRRDLFVQVVYPAVRQLAGERAVELVVTGIPPDALAPAPGVGVAHVPYEVSYGKALAHLAARRIDVLAHPTPPSRNNPYKNANVLINARSIGAVPVLSDLPPYDVLESPSPALLCSNDSAAWYGALRRLSTDPVLSDNLFAHVTTYCERHFSGAMNKAVIEQILAHHASPGRLTRGARRVVAAAPLGADRINATARRLFRSRLS
jgi:hypothetical protein